MKSLVLGYGSIGKRHARILNEQLGSDIEVITHLESCKYPHYSSLAEAGDLQRFDYFVIATDTKRHYQNLVELDSMVSHRIILVEKPLFYLESKFMSQHNKIYIGYNLRFHPALQKMRELLNNKNVFAVNAHVGEYLPWWRPGTDYRRSYSAKRDSGGGVVFDLSHEIDYLRWLFGSMTKMISLTGHLSDLEIDSDDYSAILGITEHNTAINLSMDYVSMIPIRSIIASANDLTVQLDLEHGLLSSCDSNHDINNWDFSDLDRDFTYRSMHSAIIENRILDVCNLEEAFITMRTIKNVYQNNIKERFYGV